MQQIYLFAARNNYFCNMTALSINQLKYYTSLQQKKYRNLHNCFLIEGEKMILEFLQSESQKYKVLSILALPGFIQNHKKILKNLKCIEIEARELKKISSFTTPNQAILEIEIPRQDFDLSSIQDSLSLFLDDIRDPGNLGTIIRTADWFGITNLFCSSGSVDLYNPKVLQASMGSFSRVNVVYMEAKEIIRKTSEFADFELIATAMKGLSLFENNLPAKGLLFFGNESKGLPEDLISECNYTYSIPPEPSIFHQRPDSLNLGMSAGIFMAEISRRKAIQNEN